MKRIFVLASLTIISISMNRPCLAQNVGLDGVLVASSSCQLRPLPADGEEEPCPAVIPLLSGGLRFEGQEGVVDVTVEEGGRFSAVLPSGTYRISLTSLRVSGRRLNPRVLALSRRRIKVSARDNGMPQLLLVRHRTRPSGHIPGIAY
jgi:hypothetical protein